VIGLGSTAVTVFALGGIVVFLIWLWITNVVILLRAELNAELERGRLIEAGHPADSEPYLPMRDELKQTS
jgi:membrane protein